MTNPVSEYLQGFQQVVMAAAEGKHAGKVLQLCGGAPGEERGNENLPHPPRKKLPFQNTLPSYGETKCSFCH